MITKEELSKIEYWDKNNQEKLIYYLCNLWRGNKKSYDLKGTNVLYFSLHTRDLDDNNEIIATLKKTNFWFHYWQKSIRGGHHYFKFPLKVKKKF